VGGTCTHTEVRTSNGGAIEEPALQGGLGKDWLCREMSPSKTVSMSTADGPADITAQGSPRDGRLRRGESGGPGAEAPTGGLGCARQPGQDSATAPMGACAKEGPAGPALQRRPASLDSREVPVGTLTEMGRPAGAG